MKKKLISIIILFVVVAVYIGRVIYIDVTRPEFRIEKDVYNINETVIHEDFEYKVEEFELLEPEELVGKYDVDGDFDNKTVKFLVAKVSVKYIGDEQEKVTPLKSAKFESKSWKNSSEYTLLRSINKKNLVFKPQQTKELYFIVKMSSVQFYGKEWDNVRNRTYYLVLDTYPRKVEIKCN